MDGARKELTLMPRDLHSHSSDHLWLSKTILHFSSTSRETPLAFIEQAPMCGVVTAWVIPIRRA